MNRGLLRWCNNTSLRVADEVLPPGALWGTAISKRHMVGTNRLWGGMLGISIHQDSSGTIPLAAAIRLAVLSRIVFVIEDRLDDEYISDQELRWLTDYRGSAKSELMRVNYEIRSIVNDIYGIDCWHHQEPVLSLDHSLYESCTNKISYVLSPLRTFSRKGSGNMADRTDYLLFHYFSCQLLDDFNDLESDRIRKSDKNMLRFLDRLDIPKSAVLLALLDAIKSGLCFSHAARETSDSSVLSFYNSSALLYLDKISGNKCSESCEIHLPNLNLEEYLTCHMSVHSSDLQVRPELLQSYALGFDEPDLV